MSITRRLPNSDASRSKALTKAKAKNDSIAAPNQFLTTSTITRLDATQPLYKTSLQNRGIALALQVSSTAEASEAFLKSRTYVSQFIQVFNMGVSRGKYPMSHRAYYQLNVNSDSVPPMNSYQDVIFWGENIETGDTARIAAGGAAMENPSADEVKDVVDVFIARNNDQSVLKDAYDTQQELVAGLNEEADKVIKKVWDEVETFYNEEENSSKRRKCREWGVVYTSDVEHTFNLVVVDAASNAGLNNVTIVLVETGNTTKTNSNGGATIKSTIIDEATFRFTHPDYQPLEVVVLMPAGVTTFEVSAMMEAL